MLVSLSVHVYFTANTPDVVPNVTATAISDKEVNVTWSPPSTPDGYPVMAYFVDYQVVHGNLHYTVVN